MNPVSNQSENKLLFNHHLCFHLFHLIIYFEKDFDFIFGNLSKFNFNYIDFPCLTQFNRFKVGFMI